MKKTPALMIAYEQSEETPHPILTPTPYNPTPTPPPPASLSDKSARYFEQDSLSVQPSSSHTPLIPVTSVVQPTHYWQASPCMLHQELVHLYLTRWLTSEAGGGSVGFSGCFERADSGLWFMCAGV